MASQERRARGRCPSIVNHYVEDEFYPTERFINRAHSLQEDVRALGGTAEFSSTDRFMQELRKVENIPSFFADLNPAFSGCFAQRIHIRLNNRNAENAVLEAEKWLTLRGIE